MSDIFEETEETLSREKWAAIAKKAAPWAAGAAGLALAIALGVWGYTAWQDGVRDKASETFQAAMDLSATDGAAAKAKFEETAKNGNGAYRAMALQSLAGLALRDNKTDEAIRYLDEAAKASGDPNIADLAAYKAALLVMDKGNYVETEKRLKPLTADKRPFSFLAREALAMAKLQNGDATGARTDLNALSFALGVPEGVKQRAQIYVQAIDAGAADTIKSIMALPPAEVPTMPAGLPDGVQIPTQ